MRVKIKPIVHVIGEEELIIIPLARNGDFIEALNFYEDVPNGRLARLILVLDKYGEIRNDEIVGIKGKKAVVECEGVKEDIQEISKHIKIDRAYEINRVPLFFDIEVLKEVDTSVRGVRGFINYVSAHGRIDVSKLFGIVKLEVLEERV